MYVYVSEHSIFFPSKKKQFLFYFKKVSFAMNSIIFTHG